MAGRENNVVKFKKLDASAVIPSKGSENAVGLDLTVIGVKNSTKRVCMYHTGLSVEPPSGYYFEIHVRSSLHKQGWMLANSVGVIDPDYRGELLIALCPVSDCFSVNSESSDLLLGTRVAQLVLKKNHMHNFGVIEVNELSTTTRGDGGFGSTGR